MTITLHTICAIPPSVAETMDIIPREAAYQIYIPAKDLPQFRELVSRAMNTWADAPPELKEFADLLIEGKVLQDYKSQV